MSEYDDGWIDGSNAQNDGDHEFIIKPLKKQIKQLETDNKLLKTAIVAFGDNPVGFDWAVLDKIEKLENVKDEAQKIINTFKKIGRFQNQRLGHGLEMACKNWGEASDTGGMIDFSGLIEALEGEQNAS